jgi:endonuclease-3
MEDFGKDRLSEYIGVLERLYGIPHVGEMDPVDLLVSTILSQNTSDVNSHRAFAALKRKYPHYEDMLGASTDEIADCIRLGGLAEIKAQRIRDALFRIKHETGVIGLDFLRDLKVDVARDYLLSLPGVGPKTASVVLLFGFGMDTMPVDTHVNRVSRRLGLVPESASIADAQSILEKATPRDKFVSFHINLIRHGRQRCKARAPMCEECELKEICEYAASHKD